VVVEKGSQEEANIKDGTHRDDRASSETVIRCELVQSSSEAGGNYGTMDGELAEMLVEQLTHDLIDLAYRDGQKEKTAEAGLEAKATGRRQLLKDEEDKKLKAEKAKGYKEALARAVPDAVSWSKMLAQCDGQSRQEVWGPLPKNGDRVTFMICVLSAIINVFEPFTARITKDQALAKFQNHKWGAKAAGKPSPYFTCAKQLNYAWWRLGTEAEQLSARKEAGSRMKEVNEWVVLYGNYIKAKEEEGIFFFEYEQFTNVLVYAWAAAFSADGEASSVVRLIWKILGLMSFEMEYMLTVIVSVDTHRGQRLPDNIRGYIYLLTHCVFCLCEYGIVAIERGDKRPGVFSVSVMYAMAQSVLEALTNKYIFSADQSLRGVIETETELIAEVAAALVLLEPNNTVNPRGMRMTPLHVYDIMNKQLMTEEGVFEKTFLDKLESAKDPYTTGHHYITFAFLRAVLERASLQEAQLIPNAVCRLNGWAYKAFFHVSHPKISLFLPTVLWRKVEEFVLHPEGYLKGNIDYTYVDLTKPYLGETDVLVIRS